MPEPHAHPVRTWGFRLSAVDVIAMCVAPLCAWAMAGGIGPVAWALPVALGHFFLFCNVFRIGRAKELWWAAGFVAQVAIWVAIDRLSWPIVITIQAPVTIAVIGLELRSPRYHGVAARRLNPQLGRYLDGSRLYRIFRGYDNPRHGCRLRPPQKNMIAMPNVSAWR